MNYITGKTSFGVMAPSAVSLGKFDGLHRGHQKLLQHILEQKKNGLEATIFTFAAIRPVCCQVCLHRIF